MGEFDHIGKQIARLEAAAIERAERNFILAAAKVERDVRLHDLTPDEQRSLVVAVLEAVQ